MRFSDEFNLWKMATCEEETIWKYITAQGWGKEMFIVEIIQNFKAPCNCHLARRGRLVHHSRTLSKWIPCSKRRQNCFPSPLCLPEIRFCICQILKGVSFAFSSQKKVPFIACKDFGQDAQNARVANWWRQCIESAIGKNAGEGGNVAMWQLD